MRILIVTTQVPFVRGGAEILAESLRAALVERGHEAEIMEIPFKWYPPERILDHMLQTRLLDVSESNGVEVDLVIGLKFPAYLIRHPNKVLWLLHQHRSAYDLWESPLCDLVNYPNGRQVRDAIRHADRVLLPEAKAIHTIARNVSDRLARFCGMDSQVLYHPPANAERFHCLPAEDFLFFPSRITELKRQGLVVEALAHTRSPVRVVFAGVPENPAHLADLQARSVALGTRKRVEWLGNVSEEQKIDLYARCAGVVYPPVDEDYGYVTLEAMLSSKPVITTRDAGGPLEFVEHDHNGLVCEPSAEALANAMDEIWRDRARARELGSAGLARYRSMKIDWSNVVAQLTGDGNSPAVHLP
jgi:glycosyltransferase involved in cell wall biosynthesis